MRIGIDIGGTMIKAGIINETGDILEQVTIPTNVRKDYRYILNNLCEIIKKFHNNNEAEVFVGIGIPGILSGDGKTIVSCPNLNWKNIHLVEDIQKCIGIDVLLANDATVACVAEAAFGSLKDIKSGVLITLGTGIGGGIILNQRIITGAHGVASEVGHMIMGENFYDCQCGKNGCLETFASATALIKYCEMRLNKGAESLLMKEKNFDAKKIMDYAKLGDPLALEAINRLTDYLGRAIGIIIDIIDPEVFVIGGGLSNAGDFLMNKIRESAEKYITYPEMIKPIIVSAQLKNNAGMIGAGNLREYI